MNDTEDQDAVIERTLRGYYRDRFSVSHGPAPAPAELWQRVSSHLEAAPSAQSSGPYRFGRNARLALPDAPATSHVSRIRPRLALVASFMLAVLVVSGLIYAEIIMRPSNPGGYAPPVHRLEFTDINVSKTIGHMTIHLQKAYADTNNVYIEATTDYAGNVDFAPPSSYWTTTLTTSSGATIPFLSGSTVFDGLSGTSANRRTIPSTYSFDGAAIHGNPPSLHLTLRLAPPLQFPVPAHPEYPQELTSAPLDFTFTVPFHTGKVIPVHQTVTAHGYSLTLDHVVIAPSETRIYFKKDPVTDNFYAYATQLQVAGGQVYISSPGTAVNGPAGAAEYAIVVDTMTSKVIIQVPSTATPGSQGAFQTPLDQRTFASLEGQTGRWTLHITQVYDYSLGVISGNWEFSFVVA